MKKESFERKLFIPRDVEGMPNKEELESARYFERALAPYKEFVGLSLLGSIIAGYSAEGSDIDIHILWDASENPSSISALLKKAYELRRELKEIRGEEVQYDFTFLNINAFQHDLELGKQKGDFDSFVGRALVDLSRLAIGGKIELYRKKFVEAIHHLSQEDQREIFKAIIERLVDADKVRLGKRRERVPELSEAEHEKVLEMRQKMWEKRVKKIWGI